MAFGVCLGARFPHHYPKAHTKWLALLSMGRYGLKGLLGVRASLHGLRAISSPTIPKVPVPKVPWGFFHSSAIVDKYFVSRPLIVPYFSRGLLIAVRG